MKFKNQNGTSLVFVLIITFVLMTIILGYAYQSRLYSLMSSTVIDSLDTRIKADSFFKSYYKDSNVGPITIDDITYSVTKAESQYISAGDTELIDASMYSEVPMVASSQFVVQYSLEREGRNIYSQERLIIDAGGSNSYYKYDQELSPLNVPYVDESTFPSAEQDYRLSNGKNLDGETGYIGTIQYNNITEKIFLISQGGVSTEINLPLLDTPVWPISEVDIGWDLRGGRWNMFLAISIKQADSPNLEYAVYTSKTSVRNLVDSPNNAVLDLSSWTKVLSSVSADSDVATPYRNMTWFNSSSDYEPKLFVLNNDDSSNPSVNTLFKVVEGFYDTTSSTLIGNYSKQGDFYPVAVRNMDSFTSGNILIPASIPGSLDEFYQSDSINYRVFPSQATVQPTFVIDTNDQNNRVYYYVEANGSYIYRHDFVLANTTNTAISVKGALGAALNGNGLFGTVKSIMVKYGLYFVAADWLYAFVHTGQMYFIVADGSAVHYQVLFDLTAEESKMVYQIPEGLECQIANNCAISDRNHFDHFVSEEAVQIGNINTGVFYKRDT